VAERSRSRIHADERRGVGAGSARPLTRMVNPRQ
jgi:hypothetical protein